MPQLRTRRNRAHLIYFTGNSHGAFVLPSVARANERHAAGLNMYIMRMKTYHRRPRGANISNKSERRISAHWKIRQAELFRVERMRLQVRMDGIVHCRDIEIAPFFAGLREVEG